MKIMFTTFAFSLCVATYAAEPAVQETATKREAPIRSSDRVVFLGDSNTYAGKFIAYLHASTLAAEKAESEDALRDVEFLNLGLSSETASGLSEPDHPFPRPCVLERIDRVLERTKPDVVIACYGVNDAIYYPFDEERFSKFKAGMEQVIKKSKAAGVRIILMTPPPFDAIPMKSTNKLRPADAEKFAWFAPYENYDDVMAKYAAWERGLKEIDGLIDLHKAFHKKYETERKQDAKFAYSKDGVHLDDDGHRFMAEAILKSLRLPNVESTKESVDLIMRRQTILRDAWLSHVGHKRPGIKKGLPLDQAEAEAKKLFTQIK